jgi:hypothetical protein
MCWVPGRSRQIADRFDAIICKTYISEEASVHSAGTASCLHAADTHKSETGMRKTGAQLLANDVGDRNGGAPRARCRRTPVLQVVELSGREVEAAPGRSTIACVGCAGRSCQSQIDSAIIYNNLREPEAAPIQQASHHVYDAADGRIQEAGMRKTGASR